MRRDGGEKKGGETVKQATCEGGAQSGLGSRTAQVMPGTGAADLATLPAGRRTLRDSVS